MSVPFTTKIFREGRMFVAYTPELDVSSCGSSKEKAAANLRDAVRLFLQECKNMGTLERVLNELA